MSLLIYAGLLYLFGISILLTFKPELMFSPNGHWKEFGLGRSKERYTWMPFWLFAILWAIISYLLVLILATHTGIGGVQYESDLSIPSESLMPENVSTKSISNNRSKDMKPGYYLLDTKETMKHGVPKYVFLGPQTPDILFHNATTESE